MKLWRAPTGAHHTGLVMTIYVSAQSREQAVELAEAWLRGGGPTIRREGRRDWPDIDSCEEVVLAETRIVDSAIDFGKWHPPVMP